MGELGSGSTVTALLSGVICTPMGVVLSGAGAVVLMSTSEAGVPVVAMDLLIVCTRSGIAGAPVAASVGLEAYAGI